MPLASLSRAALRAVPFAFATVALTACDEDPFSPYWDRGTYYLSYANNRSVPAIVSGGQGTSRLEVTGGSLTLRRDHSYQLLVTTRSWSASGNFFESTRAFAGTYDNDERTIYLNYFEPRDYYSNVMVANWRNGRIEVVVPNIDGVVDVLCTFN